MCHSGKGVNAHSGKGANSATGTGALSLVLRYIRRTFWFQARLNLSLQAYLIPSCDMFE
jgi:hypothetical protein